MSRFACITFVCIVLALGVLIIVVRPEMQGQTVTAKVEWPYTKTTYLGPVGETHLLYEVQTEPNHDGVYLHVCYSQLPKNPLGSANFHCVR